MHRPNRNRYVFIFILASFTLFTVWLFTSSRRFLFVSTRKRNQLMTRINNVSLRHHAVTPDGEKTTTLSCSRNNSITRTRRFAIATIFEPYHHASAVPKNSSSVSSFIQDTLQSILENKLLYASQHQYDFIIANTSVCDGSKRKNPAFAKICLLLRLLDVSNKNHDDDPGCDYDWILLLDHDAIVANPLISIEERLTEFLGSSSALLDSKETLFSKDLVISQDWNGLNTGVMFVRGRRHSSWPHQFFRTLLHSPPRECSAFEPRWWEQGVMQCILKHPSHAAANWKIQVIHEQRKMNSYPEPFNFGRRDAKYEDGDFIAHFAGASGDQTKFSLSSSSNISRAATRKALEICKNARQRLMEQNNGTDNENALTLVNAQSKRMSRFLTKEKKLKFDDSPLIYGNYRFSQSDLVGKKKICFTEEL